MRNNLEAITKGQNRSEAQKYKEQKHFKTVQQPRHHRRFLKLSDKLCKINQMMPKTAQYISDPFSQKSQQIKHKQVQNKLSTFIKKIQETIKKILSQKDVKKYLEYAKTSESEIIDNFNRALDKFRAILYHLRECESSKIKKGSSQSVKRGKDTEQNSKTVMSESYLNGIGNRNKSSSGFSNMKHDRSLNNEFTLKQNTNFCNHPSSLSCLFYHPPKYPNFPDSLQQDQNNQIINYDILQFLLQYFEQHMIPETHWSLKEQFKHTLKYNYTAMLTHYIPMFKFNSCRPPAQNQTTLQNLPQLEITKTVSNIVDEINKQEQQNLINLDSPTHQGQKFTPKPVEETLNAILKIEQLKPIETMTSTQKIAYLLELQSKIFVSGQFIKSATFFVDDITTLSKTQYQNVWQYVNQNSIGNEEMINQQYKLMKMLMIITNASVIKQLETDSTENSWFKKIIFGLSFPRYFFDFSQAKLQNHKFLRKPNVNTTKSIWNLPQNGFIKQLKKPFIFDYIESNIQFYVERTRSRHLRNFKKKVISQNKDIFTPNSNSFKVRLLNYRDLEIKGRRRNNQSTKVYETIIIHYHGGGFIALSSCTSQSYTRKWANSLQVPVFSVDYGKPPEFRFPVPVLDCLDAYIFITEHITKFFPQIRPKKIIVTGDSAGGNLACSLTALTLKLSLKVPYGLLLAYPAIDTRKKFTPSRINSYNDVVLYPTLLLLCMQEYLGSQEHQSNPLASPILLTQDFVKENDAKNWPLNWPKTIIMVGKKDPLYDDSLRLCQKLASSNIEFHCQTYKYLTHAFLSIDKMVPQCLKTIQDSIKLFQKLISGQKIGVGKLI